MRQSRWPVHPHPIKYESILSWLSRIANCYEFTVKELLKYDLGFHDDPNDLTLYIPDCLLKLLSHRTGINKQKIRNLTVASWEPFLFGVDSDFESYVHHYSLLIPLSQRKKYLPKTLWNPWLPLLWNASKACPKCVTNNPRDLIFLAWYLPIMLSCPIHQCMLRPCFSYHGRFVIWEKESDLQITFSSAINTMDQRTWSAITTSEVKLPQRTVHSSVWLRLLRTLLDELHIPISFKHPLYTNMMSIWEESGVMPGNARSRWCPYEKLPFQSQQIALMIAATAIKQIENKTISPSGKHAHLFL